MKTVVKNNFVCVESSHGSKFKIIELKPNYLNRTEAQEAEFIAVYKKAKLAINMHDELVAACDYAIIHATGSVKEKFENLLQRAKGGV